MVSPRSTLSRIGNTLLPALQKPEIAAKDKRQDSTQSISKGDFLKAGGPNEPSQPLEVLPSAVPPVTNWEQK